MIKEKIMAQNISHLLDHNFLMKHERVLMKKT